MVHGPRGMYSALSLGPVLFPVFTLGSNSDKPLSEVLLARFGVFLWT